MKQLTAKQFDERVAEVRSRGVHLNGPLPDAAGLRFGDRVVHAEIPGVVLIEVIHPVVAGENGELGRVTEPIFYFLSDGDEDNLPDGSENAVAASPNDLTSA